MKVLIGVSVSRTARLSTSLPIEVMLTTPASSNLIITYKTYRPS